MINKFKGITKYKPVITNVIAKKENIKKDNIVLFKTEYDCIKKISDMFVSKNNQIITTYPAWSLLST